MLEFHSLVRLEILEWDQFEVSVTGIMTNEDINLQQIPIISQIYAIGPIIRRETPPITARYYGRWMVKNTAALISNNYS